MQVAGLVVLIGSSPRVRGTGEFQRQARRLARFIPACAGNGNELIKEIRQGTVHPRVCGERCADRSRAKPMIGSSPRVRGTVYNQLLARVTSRFIPACAGNGSSVRARASTAPVHPRVCGERFGLSA